MIKHWLADATAAAIIASAVTLMTGAAFGQTETRSSVTTNTIDTSGNRTETTRTYEQAGPTPVAPPQVTVERSTTTTTAPPPPPPVVNETTRTTTTTTTNQ